MGLAVLKFLSLVIICIVTIDGVLCHEEGKTPTTSEYSHLPLNISYTSLQLFELPKIFMAICCALNEN